MIASSQILHPGRGADIELMWLPDDRVSTNIAPLTGCETSIIVGGRVIALLQIFSPLTGCRDAKSA